MKTFNDLREVLRKYPTPESAGNSHAANTEIVKCKYYLSVQNNVAGKIITYPKGLGLDKTVFKFELKSVGSDPETMLFKIPDRHGSLYGPSHYKYICLNDSVLKTVLSWIPFTGIKNAVMIMSILNKVGKLF